MKPEFSYFQLLLIIVYLKYVKLVPDEYCLSPLNRSDCGTPPTPVFSYFKYGSRCEIETWRGCPTDNMFENEYHCAHYCLGKTKYYGRERGSWKGKVGISLEKLSFVELEEVNRIVDKIDTTIESKEMLLHHKKDRKRPKKLNKATDKADEDSDESDETTVEASEKDMDETGEEYDELVDTTLIYLTQEPVTGTHKMKGEILRFKRNINKKINQTTFFNIKKEK
ncbi:uncharacterized protein LOC134665467 [Cydia fagiglandana]|uniref:uncharacterized protein LOC134665467 n=1 Tax=Cydia fagiglandana TaxID=1458189 RepID=UPI002FEE349F